MHSLSLAPRRPVKNAGDREVRELLKRHLLTTNLGHPSVILDELGLCQGNVRVDVAVVNGELSGFEIKSPADTLARWPKQRRLYSKVVDRAWLVAPEKTIGRAKVPEWWGLIKIVQTQDRLGLRVVRESGLNPRPDAYSIARLLWRDEAIDALDGLGLSRGVRTKRRALAWRRLADQAPLDYLRAAVRAALKVRPERVATLNDSRL